MHFVVQNAQKDRGQYSCCWVKKIFVKKTKKSLEKVLTNEYSRGIINKLAQKSVAIEP